MTKEDDDAIFEKAFTREAQPDAAEAIEKPEAGKQEVPQETEKEAKAPDPVAEKPAQAQQQAEAQPAPELPPAKPQIDPEQFKGYLDEKFKRREAEQERDRLRAELQAFQQQKAQTEKKPDFYEDPDGYRSYVEAEYDKRLMTMKVQQSEFMAVRDFGAELVGKVKDWAVRLDDARANHLLAQASPLHAAVEMYRQEQASETLRKYDYDVEKMRAEWLKEAQTAQPQPHPAPTQQAAPNLPPKVAGAGGAVPQPPQATDDDFFRAVFTRKTGT